MNAQPGPGDDLITAALPAAADLTIAVHDLDQEAVTTAVNTLLAGDRNQLAATLVALAALVPDDAPIGDLLAWTDRAANDPDHPYGAPGPDEGEKECTVCGDLLPLTEFHRDRSRKDGRTYACRYCRGAPKQDHPRPAYSSARGAGRTRGAAALDAQISIGAALRLERARTEGNPPDGRQRPTNRPVPPLQPGNRAALLGARRGPLPDRPPLRPALTVGARRDAQPGRDGLLRPRPLLLRRPRLVDPAVNTPRPHSRRSRHRNPSRPVREAPVQRRQLPRRPAPA